jgi:putative Mn2+ efflux pump MntP
MPVIVIGIVTFFMSFAGVMVSTKIGHFFEKKIEIIGGLILIGIGTKILLQHLL